MVVGAVGFPLCGIMHAGTDKMEIGVITKRMVGVALVVLGLAIAGAVLAVDAIGAGKWSGIGPAQLLAIRLSVVVFLVGLTLIPLGDAPA